MPIRRAFLYCSVVTSALLAGSWDARAQGQPEQSPWFVEVGIGFDNSINGNVNAGAIGILQGQATAFVPNSYDDIYGTGVQFRIGGGYALDDLNELRGIFTIQSADADLVRLGDIGPSSLYSQYSDYQVFALDFGYRRYFPITTKNIRLFGEGTIGVGFIDSINAVLAAPQANLIFEQTDLYDQTAAFTFSLSAGVLFPVAEQVDLSAQLGFRRASGLSEVDQFVGTGLDDFNNDSARLTFPILVSVRFRFR